MKVLIKYSLLLLYICTIQNYNIKAQAFEPRFLSEIPLKSNFVVASYAYSKGDILLDVASPIQDLESSANSILFAYVRTFKLFNRLTKADVIMPYSFADFNAIYNGEPAATTRNGFGDPMFRLSMVIVGVEPLEVKDFIKRKPKKFKFGAGIRISPPLGQYDPTKIINLGTNRWTFKIGLSASYTLINRIILEGQLKTWFFTQNNNFFNGSTIKQSPLISPEFHLTYIFKPGVWISGSVGYVNSGNTYINDVEQDKTHKNARFGLTYSHKINKKNALKVSFTNGIPNQFAIDYTSLIFAYVFLWFDKK